MKIRHHWLVIYDISNPRRLQRAGKLITQCAVRIQDSVFEMTIDDHERDLLRKKMSKIINSEEDSVIWFKICCTDWEKRKKWGPGAEKTGDLPDFLIL